VSVITEILDRLSGIEVVKERLRETGVRVEQLGQRMVHLDQQVRDVDRRLVRIEAFAEVAKTRQGGPRKLPRNE